MLPCTPQRISRCRITNTVGDVDIPISGSLNARIGSKRIDSSTVLDVGKWKRITRNWVTRTLNQTQHTWNRRRHILLDATRLHIPTSQTWNNHNRVTATRRETSTVAGSSASIDEDTSGAEATIEQISTRMKADKHRSISTRTVRQDDMSSHIGISISNRRIRNLSSSSSSSSNTDLDVPAMYSTPLRGVNSKCTTALYELAITVNGTNVIARCTQ